MLASAIRADATFVRNARDWLLLLGSLLSEQQMERLGSRAPVVL
jgi:hypothetical protein